MNGTGRTRLPGQNYQNRTASTGLSAKGCKIGEPGQDKKERTAENDSQKNTARTGQPE
jgi:hypothetical protein